MNQRLGVEDEHLGQFFVLGRGSGIKLVRHGVLPGVSIIQEVGARGMGGMDF